jgi:uncharacterized RDD family membrane protein YckC
MDEKLERDLVRGGLSIAGSAKRIKAYVIDEVLITMIIMAAFWDSLAREENIEVVIQTINSLFFVVIGLKVVYHTLFVYLYGASLGKIIARCIVVGYDDFAKPGFMASFIRANGRIVSEMIFYIGFIWAFMNEERQTWHDKMARTLVLDV